MVTTCATLITAMRFRRRLPIRGRKALLVASVGLLTVGHFTVSRATPRDHVLHLVFQALYLIPVIGGAVWYGRRGGLGVACAVAVAYVLHLLHLWPGEPLDTINQLALVAMFLVTGTVAGTLVDRQESERIAALARERHVRRAATIQALASLSAALGVRDEYTRQHSERVADLAVRIGRLRGLPPDRLEVLRLAAQVHDLGKIGIPDDILSNPHELTPGERAVIERHPQLAADILAPLEGSRDIATIILRHHECPDGSGYPGGLVGDEIPLEAAILRVADVFVALTDTRVYKPAFAPELALERLRALSGTKLDGPSVAALEMLQPRAAAAGEPDAP